MNIKYIISRINEYLDVNAQKSGINKRFLFVDCVWNCMLQRCTIRDYFIYNFYWLNKKGKRNYISGIEQNSWQEKHNDSEMQKILKNKEKSLHHFADLIDRDWCGQKYNNSEEEYNEFEKKHKFGIVKPLDLCGGEGIKRIEINKIGGVYKYCKENKCLIEEEIIQHDRMKDIYPNSVNTIRMVTYKGKLISAVLRIGRDGKEVDNLSAGGIAAGIELDNGVVYTVGRTYNDESFVYHPDTKITIPGLSIPMWEECKDLVERAVNYCQGIPVIGFDIAITQKGPTIVEVNEGTEIEVIQLPNKEGYRRKLRN